MKLSQWSKQQGLSYQTAWNYFKAGKIDGAYQTHTGTIIIPNSVVDKGSKTVIYARVSSSDQRKDLDRQVERLTNYCNAKGWKVDKAYTEIASGLNDKRSQLTKVLADKSISRIVVDHKDRFARFGIAYIELLLQLDNRELLVVNKVKGDENELMQDFVSIITSFVARLYGQGRSKRKTEQILKQLKED